MEREEIKKNKKKFMRNIESEEILAKKESIKQR
jgi:hypothetical protein